jgi:hypothetical protein
MHLESLEVTCVDADQVGAGIHRPGHLILGMHLASDIGHPFIHLDVEVRYVQGTRVLAHPCPNAILDLLLLFGDVTDAPPMPAADERSGGGVGIIPLGPGATRVLRPLVLSRGGPYIRP